MFTVIKYYCKDSDDNRTDIKQEQPQIYPFISARLFLHIYRKLARLKNSLSDERTLYVA